MKYLYLLLCLSVIHLQPAKASNLFIPHRVEAIKFSDIPDGRYKATVEYQNYGTYARATYQLVVGVKYGNVISIEFPTGGSVHSGFNNEGYYYTGGMLSENTDYQGNIISYTGTVTVTYSNGNIVTFKVTIS